MNRLQLTAILCLIAAAGWLAFGPTMRGERDELVAGHDAGPVADRATPHQSAGAAAIEAAADFVGPAIAPDAFSMACVDDESVRARQERHASDMTLPTRVDPKTVRVVQASPTMIRRAPKLSTDYHARLQLELIDRQVYVIHDPAARETFYVEVPDQAPRGVEPSRSLFEVYRLRTGHTLAIALEPDGTLLSVSYGEPGEEARDIPPASIERMIALFGSATLPPPPPRSLMGEEPVFQMRIVCSVSERVRVGESGEIETVNMTVECIAGPSANPSEFFILPLTP